ncbi:MULTISPECIES: glyoxalase superfamily protein [Paenibacillus]|uniref:glyoxalase superfamily protein n=1 Tax=Paenibacillus TaxID=44249 RepID=UPI0022B88049|nr:glyoxalase superfamily protein [Paenibacillus caseinilyticus]MCZ8522547.1 glyoxalase superfamily protein [Paenibacillus caseinilyticus]
MTAYKGIIPLLRSFDEGKAKEFYADYLGGRVDWEHRFEMENRESPLYMQVSLGDVRLHLTEHYGDCCPGASVRLEVGDLEVLHRRLLGQAYAYSRPGMETTPWGTREVRVTDPFGNRITFYEELPE